jgi:hypothetical protein
MLGVGAPNQLAMPQCPCRPLPILSSTSDIAVAVPGLAAVVAGARSFRAVLFAPRFITQRAERAAPVSPTTSMLLWDQLDGN